MPRPQKILAITGGVGGAKLKAEAISTSAEVGAVSGSVDVSYATEVDDLKVVAMVKPLEKEAKVELATGARGKSRELRRFACCRGVGERFRAALGAGHGSLAC